MTKEEVKELLNEYVTEMREILRPTVMPFVTPKPMRKQYRIIPILQDPFSMEQVLNDLSAAGFMQEPSYIPDTLTFAKYVPMLEEEA